MTEQVDLQSFCEPTRKRVSVPWASDQLGEQRTLACDGRLLVAIPGTEQALPLPVGIKEIGVASLFKPTPDDIEWKPWPQPNGDTVRCKTCNGKGRERKDCPECRGSGDITCDACGQERDCEGCGGDGDIHDPNGVICVVCEGSGDVPDNQEIGPVLIAGGYFCRAGSLPGVEYAVFPDAKATDPIQFRFNGRGVGVLMGMRR